jgi:intracellular sulfur oxidation DsrE/DsrF family protein
MTTENDDASGGVVFHLDEADPTKHALALRNMANLLDDLGEGTPVELVMNGPGLGAGLADAPHADRMRELLGRGASVAACANSMRDNEVSVEQLIEGVHVVPSGVGQLVTRQREGWAYLRP